MEKEFDVVLFNRTSPLTLTYAGQALKVRARELLDLKDETYREIADIKDFSTGQLSIGVSHTRGRFILPEILPTYQSEFPGIELHLIEGNSSELANDLLHGTIDLMIDLLPFTAENVDTVPICQEEILLVVPDEVLKKVALGPKEADRRILKLSGGQQQRVLIARALCATTRLLILDEPITGLDPMAIQDFYAMIRRLNREDGVAILMVSHDLRNAVEEANKILHLQKQVLFYGPAHDYMNSQAAGHFFHEKEQGQCIPTAVCRKGGCCHEHTK